jgi:hypothetical protein
MTTRVPLEAPPDEKCLREISKEFYINREGRKKGEKNKIKA